MPGHGKEMWTAQHTYAAHTCPARLPARAGQKALSLPFSIDGNVAKAEPIIAPHLPLAAGIGQGGGHVTKSGPITALHRPLAPEMGSGSGPMTEPAHDFAKWRGGHEGRDGRAPSLFWKLKGRRALRPGTPLLPPGEAVPTEKPTTQRPR